jgi:curved DNA-binding protein CbpA
VEDYYRILGVERGCSIPQIKRAFRARAKTFHPDLDHSGSNEYRMRVLITAYRVLSDPEKRQEYDRLSARLDRRYEFNYRDYLRRQKGDSRSMAKLIFYDLLHGYEREALDLFEALSRSSSFRLAKYLDREDHMDCLFLLAEEYEKHRQYEQAFELLTELVLCEFEQPYFRHFFREVIDRLRIICCFKMPGRVEDAALISHLQRLVEFDFSPKDTAFFLKRIAEIYAEQNALEQAQAYLEQGLRLHAKLPGIKKLQEKLAGASEDAETRYAST